MGDLGTLGSLYGRGEEPDGGEDEAEKEEGELLEGKHG